MYPRVFFILCIVLTVTAQMRLEGTSSILDGDAQNISQVPWFAIVHYETPIRSSHSISKLCVGALVSANKIITAASCILYMDKARSYVNVGHQNSTKYNITDYRTHPLYGSRHDFFGSFNIGVIKVARNIFQSSTVSYISLPSIDEIYPENAVGRVCVFKNWRNNQHFRCVNLTFMPCNNYYNFLHNTDNERNLICANDSMSNTCPHDFGSGFVIQNKLMGLLVGSSLCNPSDNDVPSIFAKITALKNWTGVNNFSDYHVILGEIFENSRLVPITSL